MLVGYPIGWSAQGGKGGQGQGCGKRGVGRGESGHGQGFAGNRETANVIHPFVENTQEEHKARNFTPK